MLSKSTADKLIKLGYKTKNLQDLFNALPAGIFFTSDAVHLKREKTIFMLSIDLAGYTLFWMIKDESKDPTVIHKITGKELDEILGKMILFTEKLDLPKS